MSPKHRARRGAVAAAILKVLDDGPSHGYAIMDELEKRSDARWRPSSGSLYPALGRMSHRGLIKPLDGTDPQEFEITEAGRQWLSAAAADMPPPWAGRGPGRDDSHPGLAELRGAVRQIERFGTDDQRAAANAAVEATTRQIYGLLAQPPETQQPETQQPETQQPETQPADDEPAQ